jgi:membrane complex biogenesis BtpA family protein
MAPGKALDRFSTRFSSGKVLLGMVHLRPLPGSPGNRGEPLESIIEKARRDASALIEGGLDGCIIENFGDVPFWKDRVPAHVVAAMTRIACEVAAAFRDGSRPLLGVNVLRNDALAALAVAHAADLDLIRVNVHAGAMVTDQGIVEGRAAETLRERILLGASVAIAADVLVKHASPLGGGPLADPAACARDLAERALADALIVSGPATGAPVDAGRLRAVRGAVPDLPLLVGSGVTEATVAGLLSVADGAIVGTSIKVDGDVRAPVDPARVRTFVEAARRGAPGPS